MYSQRDEEVYIKRYWGDKSDGRFLDIGAYDGEVFSNTRMLVEQGWSGVFVEPSPSVHGILEQRYGRDVRFRIVKVGLGLHKGVFPFYDFSGDAVSSFDPTHAELWKEKGKRIPVMLNIPVITWEELLADVGRDFDFINIDAEAWSVDLIEAMPFKSLTKLKMICVEFDRKEGRVLRAVQPHGFELIHKTPENMLLVKNRKESL